MSINSAELSTGPTAVEYFTVPLEAQAIIRQTDSALHRAYETPVNAFDPANHTNFLASSGQASGVIGETVSSPRYRVRGEEGFITSLLSLKLIAGIGGVGFGSVLAFQGMLGASVSASNHTELNVTKAQDKVEVIYIGGADFCPVRADFDSRVNSAFKAKQTVGASFHGHGAHVSGPTEKWGVDMHATLTGPACFNRKTGIRVVSVTMRSEQIKDKKTGVTKTIETPVVYAKLKKDVPLSFDLREKDPVADTFTIDDNEYAKFLNLTGAQLALFPFTGFLKPHATDDIHTLLHEVDLTAGVNTAATECEPLVMEAAEPYLESLVEDDMFQELKSFGVRRENIHDDMSNLKDAKYEAQYADSEAKLRAVSGLNYSSVAGTCTISKDPTIEVSHD